MALIWIPYLKPWCWTQRNICIHLGCWNAEHEHTCIYSLYIGIGFWALYINATADIYAFIMNWVQIIWLLLLCLEFHKLQSWLSVGSYTCHPGTHTFMCLPKHGARCEKPCSGKVLTSILGTGDRTWDPLVLVRCSTH